MRHGLVDCRITLRFAGDPKPVMVSISSVPSLTGDAKVASTAARKAHH
jgi:hypothetical protein